MNKLIGVAAVVVLASAGMGQADKARESESAKRQEQPRSVSETLDARVPEIIFEEVPLGQVMEWVADYTGINVWVRWQALEEEGVERDKPITIKVRNLPLAQVLWMILSEAGGPDVKLGYGTLDNLLIVSTRSDLNEEVVVKVYDVRDLLVCVPRFRSGMRLNPSQALGQPGQPSPTSIGEPSEPTPEAEPEDEIQKLVNLIVNMVEPDSWQENGGVGTIMGWQGRIIVRNSIYVHQQLGGTLRAFEGR